jgi:hypothetical protein
VGESQTTIGNSGDSNKIILAFYSSCTNKPHRFQFIYLNDLTEITKDKDGKINNKDCQYYIEFEPSAYTVKENVFFLPTGFSLHNGNPLGHIYNDARAERYDFAHQTEYSPKLDRYIYKYHKYVGENEESLEEGESIDNDGFVEYMKEDGTKERKIFYGYQDSEYFSPALVPNLITNTKFDSTTGWTGTKIAGQTEKCTVRNVYGHFLEATGGGYRFVDSADELLAGTFNPDYNDN